MYTHSRPSLSSTWRICSPGKGLGYWDEADLAALPENKGEGLQEGGVECAKYPELELRITDRM